jgi:tetratricopeptide (TPR) repeat protein
VSDLEAIRGLYADTGAAASAGGADSAGALLAAKRRLADLQPPGSPHPDADYWLGHARGLRDPRRALAAVELGLGAAPTSPIRLELAALRVELLLARGDLAAATEAMGSVGAPARQELLRGRLLLQQQRYAEALSVSPLAAAAHPAADARLRLKAALALGRADDGWRAAARLLDALAHPSVSPWPRGANGSSSHAYWDVLKLAERTGQWRACSDLLSDPRRDPDGRLVRLWLLAWCAERAGETTQAVRALDDLGPNARILDAAFLTLAARVYDRAGRPEDAARHALALADLPRE